MSHLMRYQFRLFGPRRGKTMTVNGHQFINGVAEVINRSDTIGPLVRVLSFYGAYMRGSKEYDEALAKEEAEHGPSKDHAAPEQRADAEVRGDVRPDGDGPAEAVPNDGAGDDDAEGAAAGGSDSSGDGHGHAGIPQFPEDKDYRDSEPASESDPNVSKAVVALDPTNDDHWVATGAMKGKPKLSAVEEAYGKAGLTRKDIEAAMPGWTREKAAEAALAGDVEGEPSED